MLKRWLMLTMVGLACPLWAAERTDTYFPLTPGATWKYQVTIKDGDAEPKLTSQTVTVEEREIGGKRVIIASDNAYQAKDDGVYIVGVMQDGKLQPLDEPQKVVPANPKRGDTWTYREAAGVTSATCLGSESVKTAAGEYDAAKIDLVTVGGASAAQTERKEVYRWFAPGVGPVKGSVLQHHANADGTLSRVEVTLELASFSAPGKGKVETGAVAGKAGKSVDALFAEAQAAARKGDHKTALADYDAALAQDPKAAKVHGYKTLSLMATHDFSGAQGEIDRALALEPREYAWHEIAGQLQVAQGKVREGKALYDEAAKLAPEHAGAVYTDLAAALAGRKDERLSPDIDAALKAAAAADPPSAPALFALGQSYVNAGRPEGRAYLQRYVEVASALPAGQRDERQIRLAKQLIRAIDAVKGAP
jgi:tetratricopeptide (TPR) repeat protein